MLQIKSLIKYHFSLRNEIYEIQKLRANLKYYKVLIIIPSLILLMTLYKHLYSPLMILIPSAISLMIDVIMNNYTASIIRIAKYNLNSCEPKLTTHLKMNNFVSWEFFMSDIKTPRKLIVSYLANIFFTLSVATISYAFYKNKMIISKNLDICFGFFLIFLFLVEIVSMLLVSNIDFFSKIKNS